MILKSICILFLLFPSSSLFSIESVVKKGKYLKEKEHENQTNIQDLNKDCLALIASYLNRPWDRDAFRKTCTAFRKATHHFNNLEKYPTYALERANDPNFLNAKFNITPYYRFWEDKETWEIKVNIFMSELQSTFLEFRYKYLPLLVNSILQNPSSLKYRYATFYVMRPLLLIYLKDALLDKPISHSPWVYNKFIRQVGFYFIGQLWEPRRDEYWPALSNRYYQLLKFPRSLGILPEDFHSFISMYYNLMIHQKITLGILATIKTWKMGEFNDFIYEKIREFDQQNVEDHQILKLFQQFYDSIIFVYNQLSLNNSDDDHFGAILEILLLIIKT